MRAKTADGSRRRRWAEWLVLGGALALVACEFHPIELLPVGPTTTFSADDGDREPQPSSSGGDGGLGGAFPTGGLGGAIAAGGIGGEPLALSTLRVLMVVDDVPISTDDAIEIHLNALSIANPIEVVRSAEAETTPADTEGYDLVVVSSSADSAGIGGSLKDIPVPILVLEPGIFSLMGLGAPRFSSMDAEILITAEAHPIAQGATGTLPICGQPVDLVGQVVAPGAVMVAQTSLNANAAAIVAIEQGTDIGGPLPERRVSFGALKLAACQTETAWDFFDAAVRWLMRK